MNPTSDAPTDGPVSGILPEIGGQSPSRLAAHFLTMLPPAAAPAHGLPVLPGWHLTHVLGAGGMGQVYHAVPEAGGEPAAVKIPDRRWTSNPVMVARFESEAETLRSLDHPGIVRLLDTAETEDGRFCLLMEYVEGCDLGRLLRTEKLPPARAAALFRQVCAAVAHAHQRGFLHRDIKPSNILVGPDGAARLADFGLARATSQEDGAIGGLTATTDQFGTAYYLAPERMTPGRLVDARADVYALGVLLYHLFAGRIPLGKFTPLSRLAGLPASIDHVISHALEADPGRRTADVPALLAGFEKSWQAHLANTSRRRFLRRLAAAAATVLLLGSTLAAGASWQRHRSPPPRPVFRAADTATREQPWENSCGMKFVPIPGTPVLFSVWETRRSDAQAFIDQWRNQLDEPWQAQIKINRQQKFRRTIATDSGLTLTDVYDGDQTKNPDLPLTLVFGLEAQNFARWLTWKEQVEGRLAPWQFYRLPTSAEWLHAARTTPPEATANHAGSESTGQPWLENGATLPAADPFAGPSPVGSFPPSPHGLFDLSGNVSEWVRDPRNRPLRLLDPDNTPELAAWNYQLAGTSFADGTPALTRPGQVRAKPKQRQPWIGFRLVLEYLKPQEESP